MTEIKPQFLDELTYAAKFDRQPIRDILTEGIVATGDLEITELDTPGMGVKAASGAGYVQGDQATTQGHYRIFNDASKNLTIAASDPTNPRKDRIIAQVYDSIDIGGVDDEWVLEVLTGVAAGVPDAPALPDDALDLAIVLVGNGVTEILNANITDQRSRISLQNVIPTGIITLWSGSIANIPSGWALCNGANGTPNLRDKFIVGAGSTYAVGVTGGAISHTLTEAQIPSHLHADGTLAMPSHLHNFGTLKGGLKTGGVVGASGNALAASVTGQYTLAISGNTGSTGGNITGNTASTGGGTAHENRPPYYALAYIMKL